MGRVIRTWMPSRVWDRLLLAVLIGGVVFSLQGFFLVGQARLSERIYEVGWMRGEGTLYVYHPQQFAWQQVAGQIAVYADDVFFVPGGVTASVSFGVGVGKAEGVLARTPGSAEKGEQSVRLAPGMYLVSADGESAPQLVPSGSSRLHLTGPRSPHSSDAVEEMEVRLGELTERLESLETPGSPGSDPLLEKYAEARPLPRTKNEGRRRQSRSWTDRMNQLAREVGLPLSRLTMSGFMVEISLDDRFETLVAKGFSLTPNCEPAKLKPLHFAFQDEGKEKKHEEEARVPRRDSAIFARGSTKSDLPLGAEAGGVGSPFVPRLPSGVAEFHCRLTPLAGGQPTVTVVRAKHR